MMDETRAPARSFRDYLDETGPLPRSVEDVATQLEKEGWECVDFRPGPGKGLRYWCPCSTQHQLFIDVQQLNEPRLEFLLRRSCFTFKETP